MAPQKLDRRVRRTRRLLREALLALMQEQPFETITIQEITDRADLNRATFYLHYGSKDELLADGLEASFDELVAQFDELSPENPVWDDISSILLTFRHMADHADLYKMLLSEKGSSYIVFRIINYTAAYGRQQLQASLPPGTPLPVTSELVCHHIAGSLFALVAWWLQNDMPYSADYMADMTKRLCAEGTVAVLGELIDS
ncbi:MAG: TetR/AcrR family transcriptional regulator [Chloroflexota bacterium]